MNLSPGCNTVTPSSGRDEIWSAAGPEDAPSGDLVAGQTAAVLVVAKLGTGGAISLFDAAGYTHLVGDGSTGVVVDVLGWFVPPLSLTSLRAPSQATVPAPYKATLSATGGMTPYT